MTGTTLSSYSAGSNVFEVSRDGEVLISGNKVMSACSIAYNAFRGASRIHQVCGGVTVVFTDVAWIGIFDALMAGDYDAGPAWHSARR